MAIIYITNDNVIELDELKNVVDGIYQNSATVIVTLTDADGAEVAGETWPLAMSYVSGSNGTYRANLADTLTLTNGGRYDATVTADAGANGLATWTEELIARERKG
jgi:hypothetical protein